MNSPLPILLPLLLAWLLPEPVRAAAPANPATTGRYLGSVSSFRGTVELRDRPDSPVVRLEADRDRYRPLREGAEVRCAAGAEVVLQLLYGRVLVHRASNWLAVPSTPPPDDATTQRLREYQERSTLGAGRTRGRTFARRALLVGIDDYVAAAAARTTNDVPGSSGPPGRRAWTNLRGCLNDVEAIASILVTRFGFAESDLLVLTNAAASREAILAAFSRHLVEPAQPGDVALLYFAGHGSRVVNSLSDEADHRDESLVPADSGQGAPDIRDKEIRRLINAALDRGAFVVALFDSCHSGSITRGLADRVRALPPDPRDVRDSSDSGPRPTLRADARFVTFSAAESGQFAQEASLEGRPHGAFSAALARALRSGSRHETAGDLFLRTHAFLKSEGLPQDPVLEMSPAARSCSLFGESTAPANPSDRRPRRSVFAVASLDTARGEVRLLGGPAAGLNPGCELRPAQPGAVASAPRLRVVRTERLARSVAQLVRGAATDLRPGDLYEIDLWAAPEQGPLRVWIPSPDTEGPLPPPELVRHLRFGPGTPNETVEHVTSMADAIYRLANHGQNGATEFAWERVGSPEPGRLEPSLPRRTDACRLEGATPSPEAVAVAGRCLVEQALRLARTRAWLQLESPADDGEFPYRLALRNAATGVERIDGSVTEGEALGLVLRRAGPPPEEPVIPRYVYVFVLDSQGRGQLLFASTSDEDGRLPAAGTGSPDVIRLGAARLLEVGAPFGIDTYFLLTSASPLPDPDVLNFDGVRTLDRGSDRGSRVSPLQRLMDRVGGPVRGACLTPHDWSVGRLTVLSRPR